MVRYILCFLCLTLVGCAATPYDTFSLEGPPARCLRAPLPLKKLASGMDLVQEDAATRRAYGRTASNLRSCQRYIRTVTGK